MDKCNHITSTLKRHGVAGLWATIFAAMVFGPRIYDTIRGEPWINNELAVIQNSSGQIIVEDIVTTRNHVAGVRANTVELDSGEVICSTEHHNAWLGQRNRFWSFGAFSGCTPPNEPYKVCSRFSITSGAGLSRFYGPFCSPVTILTAQPALFVGRQ